MLCLELGKIQEEIYRKEGPIRRYYFFNNLIFKSWTSITYYLYLDFDINRILKIIVFLFIYNLLFLQHCLVKEIF